MDDIYHPKKGCELKSVVLGRASSKKKTQPITQEMSNSDTPETDDIYNKKWKDGSSETLASLMIDHAEKLERERNEAMERIGHAEILLSDLASGYWRQSLNDQDPTGESIMGERVTQYWLRYQDADSTEQLSAKRQDADGTSESPGKLTNDMEVLP